MFAGHLGIALCARRARRAPSLALLALATYLPDVVEIALVVLGAGQQRSSMLSHSVPAVLALAIVMGVTSGAIARDRRAGAVAALLVLSHVLVDYITGSKPSWPGGPSLGLMLYRRPVWDFTLELTVIAAGTLAWWRRPRVPRARAAPAFPFPARVAVLFTTLVLLQLAFDWRQDGGHGNGKVSLRDRLSAISRQLSDRS